MTFEQTLDLSEDTEQGGAARWGSKVEVQAAGFSAVCRPECVRSTYLLQLDETGGIELIEQRAGLLLGDHGQFA